MQMPVIPIDVTAVVAVVMFSLVILIPIAGITARFALKPIAEAVARVKEAQGSTRELGLLQQRVDLLEQQVGVMESDLHRLREVQEFHARLKSSEEAPDPNS